MTDDAQDPPTVETEETTRSLRSSEDLSQSIPGFHFRQKLGEGGMGEVFEAEELEPVRRKVALKLIKRGMESKEVLARFDSERQALALMSHPNIAQVTMPGVDRTVTVHCTALPIFADGFESGDTSAWSQTVP